MKKILIASLFIFGMGAFAQAQTTEKTTAPAETAKVATATKAEAKSCCAGMASASKKECTDPKTADTTNPQSTNAPGTETAKATCTDKAAASACCAGKAVASNQAAPAKPEEKQAPAVK